MVSENRRVVIITALPLERAAVMAHLKDVKEEVHPRGSVYRRGTFDEDSESWDVLVVEIGAGNESAAAEAERAIDYFKPELALFVGVAGAIKDLARGDVVASSKIYNYTAGKDGASGFQPRPDTELPAYSLIGRARYESGEPDWLKRIRREPSPPEATPPEALVGPIAAGGQVLASTRSATYQLIRNQYSDAVAVEMEGHGFLLGVHMNHPVQGIVVRGISDCLDEKNPVDDDVWQPRAARHAAAFAFQVLAKFPLVDRPTGLSMDVSVLNPEVASWSLDKTVLRYTVHDSGGELHIDPAMGYLNDFNTGGVITPLNYMTRTWCPFLWDFPALDLRFLNNTRETIYITEVVIEIECSRAASAPFFTIKRDQFGTKAGDLLLVNEGWSDVVDLVVNFNLSPGVINDPIVPTPPYRHTVRLDRLPTSAEIEVTDAFQADGADIDGLIHIYEGDWDESSHFVMKTPQGSEETLTSEELSRRVNGYFGPFHGGAGTLSGKIVFSADGDPTTRRRVGFNAVVYLENKYRRGLHKPVSMGYETSFEIHGDNYQRRLPVSHEIGAGETDRFTVRIAVPQSSSHRFSLTARDVSGLILKSSPIELTAFVPRSRTRAVSDAMSKGVD